MTYKPPKDYKPSKLQDVLAKEHAYDLETLSRIHNSATTILHDKTTAAHLTCAEHALYTSTALLSGLLSASLSPVPRSSSSSSSAPLPTSVTAAVAGLKTTLSTLRTAVLAHSPATDETFASLTDMRTLSALRDASLATRHAAAFLLAWHERETTGKVKSGAAGGCHKDILAEMKALDGIAGKALVEVRGRIKALKGRLGEGGWLDRLLEWTFGNEEEEEKDEIVRGVAALTGGRGGAEEWAGRVLESWVEGVKGWGMVRMEV